MRGLEVRPCRVEDLLPLRAHVLRAGASLDSARYPGDERPDTLHLGAFLAEAGAPGVLVGCASWLVEAPTDHGPPRLTASTGAGWRLRGLATHPDHRGHGVAGTLLETGLATGAEQGHRRAWCTARTTVASFYRATGWRVRSGPFDTAYGPHVLMDIDLPGGSG